MTTKGFVTYLRRATAAKDVQPGLVYRHMWQTGWQDLIFPTHEAAALFAKRNDCALTAPLAKLLPVPVAASHELSPAQLRTKGGGLDGDQLG